MNSAICALTAAIVTFVSGALAHAATVVDKRDIHFLVGDQAAAHAEFLIKPRINSRHVIEISVWRAAEPGATVKLSVDEAKQAAYAAVLTEKQCRSEKSVSVCRVVVPGRSKEAAAIIAAFTSGKVLHVDVEHNGAAKMRATANLDEFMVAFNRAKK